MLRVGSSIRCAVLAITATLQATMLIPVAAASENDGVQKTLYMCKWSNGSVITAPDSCPEGTTEEGNFQAIVYPSGIYTRVPTNNAPLTGASVPKKPSQSTVQSVESRNSETLKKGQASVMKMLAFGLVFGVIGKLRKKSFVFWFLMGVIVEMVLVGAAIINP